MTNHHHNDPTNDVTYINEVKEFRAEKDHFFATSRQSPIPHEERHSGFGGLDYYPPDPTFRDVAEVAPFEQRDIVQMATTTGDIRPQLR